MNPDSIRVPAQKGTGDAGLWTTTPDGGRVWCLEIKSSTFSGGSLSGSLGLIFEPLFLASDPEAELRVYDDIENIVLGPYDSGDNTYQEFVTDEVCFADCGRISLIVAYYEPPGKSSTFSISEVIHGFAGIDSPGGSASCNLNASLDAPCTQSIPWASEIRATAQLISMNYGGGRLTASGFLINNVAEDLTPYMMVAYHSVNGNINTNTPYDSLSGGNVQIARFNYQASACGTGTVTQTPSFYALDVDDAPIYVYDFNPHDFALLELPNPIPQSYKVYYAGWSRKGALPQEGTVTGHPKNDVKKISFANSIGEYSSARWEADFNGTNDGAIESSHSGSPFFNDNNRLVGHVSTYDVIGGGQLGCEARKILFPKFSENWDEGYDDGSAQFRLKEYLDPNDTGRMTLPPVAGYDLNIADETFADSTTDRASGFFRTAGRIDAENVTVESDSRLILRAREGIRIEGPFAARAGSRFEARIDAGPTLTGLGIPETYDGLSGSPTTMAGTEPPTAAEEAPNAKTSSSQQKNARRDDVPEQVTVEPNFPNPFRTQTTLRYGLPEEAHVRVVVYDMLGRRVTTLVDERQRAGYHRLTLNADGLSTGTYLYRLVAGATSKGGTMILVR